MPVCAASDEGLLLFRLWVIQSGMPHSNLLQRRPEATTSTLSNEDIVQRVRRGERHLFEVLIRRNNQRLYRAVRSVVSDEAAAEEAMQQTYVLAFQRLEQFTGDAAFSTWLLRIGLNEGLQYLRRNRKWSGLEISSTSEGDTVADTQRASPEERFYARETLGFVEEVLERLPANYRLVLMLREVEGLSVADTATAMGVSEDAVKQRVFRAREMMRAHIEARAGEAIQNVFSFEAPRCNRVVAAVFETLNIT